MPNIYITITIDWEGATLKPVQIQAMEAFRTTFPNIPVTHFICPAYFTRVSTRVARRAQAEIINRVINERIDEVALHIHCWYSLMQNAIQQYVTVPTCYPNNGLGTGVPYGPPGAQQVDYGHAVPFGCYTQEKIRRTLVTAAQLLQSSGIKDTGDVESFRCGGWLAADKVLNALSLARFCKYEASATPGQYFQEVIWPEDQLPLDLWVAGIWSERVTAPPYLVNAVRQATYLNGITGLLFNNVQPPISQPKRMNQLIQIPDTAALADYVSLATLTAHIQEALNASATQNVFISMGWHDTNAANPNHYDNPLTNIGVIASAIPLIPPQKGIFLTVRDAAKRWLVLQQLLAEGIQPTLVGEVDTQAVMPYIPPVGPSIREI